MLPFVFGKTPIQLISFWFEYITKRSSAILRFFLVLELIFVKKIELDNFLIKQNWKKIEIENDKKKLERKKKFSKNKKEPIACPINKEKQLE